MPGNVVWKQYYTRIKNVINSRQQNIERLIQFANINIPNFYFIKALIYCGDEVVGSITDYARGKVLRDLFLCRCSIDQLIQALNELEDAVIELSNMGIVITDLFDCNMIYDGKNFKCIDASSYYYSDSDASIAYLSNMREVGKTVMASLLTPNYMFAYLQKLSTFKNYERNPSLITDPVYFIKLLKKEIEEITEQEINKFCDARVPILKALKKRDIA